ncbi:hypothetical protein [Hydrogenophaga sp.]|uniref:hypothetical protein n=1 Tax=Hydrogenophaga sp. TaxID=1904254 RepID=UPI003D1353E1
MPITFEEVTAEVPAERPSAPEAAREATTPQDGEVLARVQQALALRAERECRAQAD